MTSTSMQCPAVEDLILDNKQWQGLVYTIAGETSVANCLRTDLDQPSSEPVLSDTVTQMETVMTDEVAQDCNCALIFGRQLTLSSVMYCR